MNSPETKDIKYIEIIYKVSAGKEPMKITLEKEITRKDALKLQGIMEQHSEVLLVKCWTTRNSWI